jgi:hypothetical protein
MACARSSAGFVALRAIAIAIALIALSTSAWAERWSAADAIAWARLQSWLVGANYVPATASNVLQMWQEDTFDPDCVDLELGSAESTGVNQCGSSSMICSGHRIRRGLPAGLHAFSTRPISTGFA